MLDPRPPSRVEDPALLRRLHLVWKECVLCGKVSPLSLHHVSKHPRDDLEANLLMICGSGTTGCHGLVEARDEKTLEVLGRYITIHRPDVIRYLIEKKGESTAKAWVRLNLLIGS